LKPTRLLQRLATAAWLAVGLAAAPRTAVSQNLADFDYVNLSFRGIGAELGYLFPSRVEPTPSVGLRMDLGYLGPGVRVIPGITWWSSPLESREVEELEGRVESLIETATDAPAPNIDLGVIEWSDLSLSVDTHLVWRVPFGVLTFAGVGAAAHLMNGDGASINGTFIEDLLDSVTAGFNLHAGAEYPLSDRIRGYGQGRYEVMGDLQYFQIRLGAQLMVGPPIPGELPAP
jgi:hypothetical protein